MSLKTYREAINEAPLQEMQKEKIEIQKKKSSFLNFAIGWFFWHRLFFF